MDNSSFEYSHINPPPEAQEIEDHVSEDSEEVNYHLEGHQYDPVRFNNMFRSTRETHRLPQQLVGVKSISWFGTHNDSEYLSCDELKEVCDNSIDLLEYVVFFKETAPSTGKEHFHSLVILKKKALAHVCIEIDPRGSWEKTRGQIKTAYKYISKDGNKYFEWGQCPNSILEMIERNQVRRRAFDEPTKTELQFQQLVKRAQNGDQDVRYTMLYARFRCYFDDLLAKSHEDITYDGDLQFKNLWIQGPPGTGKSRLVWDYSRENNITVYTKNQNKWWDGYNHHKIVLIEDAGDLMKMLSCHIKIWADRYPFTAEWKGSHQRINSADFYLIVTSNYSIRELFNEKDAEAIERRFDVLEMK